MSVESPLEAQQQLQLQQYEDEALTADEQLSNELTAAMSMPLA